MKETINYFRTTSQANQSLEKQSKECREFALALEIEEIRAKELFERTKKEIEKR